MARAIWKGHITFGLVNVPVTLYSAEERSDLDFHMIDSRNQARVRYERVNAETGEEVPWDQVVKGFEYDDGNYVLLDKEDLKRASPEATKAVEIKGFVEGADIDMMYFDKPYVLEPGKRGDKGYVLLREALERSGRVGIARVVIRTRQYIAALVPRDRALVLNLLRYQQELRSLDEFDLPLENLKDYDISSQEMKMAETLVESMTTDWKPEQYHDEYREALEKWIEEKAEKGEVERAPEVEYDEEAPEPINIMKLLKQSVEDAGGGGKKKTSRKKKKKAG